MITRLEHAALSVANLDRSLAFYRDLLGFELIRTLEPRPDELLGRLTGIPGAQGRIAHLQLGGVVLELFEYVKPQGRPLPTGRTQADHGFSHIALSSNEIGADYERLKAKDVVFLSEPIEFRPGVWGVYFRGPDGETCEMRQA